MSKRRSRFKRGDRVEWEETCQAHAGTGGPGGTMRTLCRMTGTVRDVHNLGGYGFSYLLDPDPCPLCGKVVTDLELEDAHLRPMGLLDQMAEAAAEKPAAPMRTAEKPAAPMRTGLRKPRTGKGRRTRG